MLRAACRDGDTNAFFDAEQSEDVKKKYCRGCKVTSECLDYAMSFGVNAGVWGGVSIGGKGWIVWNKE